MKLGLEDLDESLRPRIVIGRQAAAVAYGHRFSGAIFYTDDPPRDPKLIGPLEGFEYDESICRFVTEVASKVASEERHRQVVDECRALEFRVVMNRVAEIARQWIAHQRGTNDRASVELNRRMLLRHLERTAPAGVEIRVGTWHWGEYLSVAIQYQGRRHGFKTAYPNPGVPA